MITVSQLLKDKRSKVLTVTPEDSVFHSLQVMTNNNVGALVVVKEKKVVGIFSERDFLQITVKHGKIPLVLPIENLMSDDVYYVRPEQTIDECMALMTDKRTRHLPVIDGEKLIGIVSIGDVVKSIIAEKEFTIHQLENCISGGLYRTNENCK